MVNCSYLGSMSFLYNLKDVFHETLILKYPTNDGKKFHHVHIHLFFGNLDVSFVGVKGSQPETPSPLALCPERSWQSSATPNGVAVGRPVRALRKFGSKKKRSRIKTNLENVKRMCRILLVSV